MSAGKVAIIESSEHVVETLRVPFEETGFELEVAQAAEAGIALCRQFLPQVVLINTNLPDGDGLQVCRELRATTRTSRCHIILLASSMDRELRLAGLETGADDFIAVPFDPAEVTLRVRNALRRAAADNLIDPVTGLPSGRMIQARLRDLLREDDWALLGLTIRNLRPFEDLHGFLAVQAVLRSAVRALAVGCERWGTPKDFIGYSGGGRFLVITSAGRPEALAEGVAAQFQDDIQVHYTFREREQGYMLLGEGRRVPLMHLQVRQTLASDGPFYDIRSLTEVLG
jgi:DNA-binding response OmpR family regulator